MECSVDGHEGHSPLSTPHIFLFLACSYSKHRHGRPLIHSLPLLLKVMQPSPEHWKAIFPAMKFEPLLVPMTFPSLHSKLAKIVCLVGNASLSGLQHHMFSFIFLQGFACKNWRFRLLNSFKFGFKTVLSVSQEEYEKPP